ncbi:sodium:solute symporter [Lentibacter algarum]|uniref:ATP-binding protein n=1 Tax=Lentibacter algarum TaxID=576131 RepID=UPI001C077462|nr:ATP-binding protein [Lentibacter algarum]MBU2982127.1 sodium:solute symporter [Lentibacter algarum]
MTRLQLKPNNWSGTHRDFIVNTSANFLAAVSVGYVALLFLVAFVAEQAARSGHARWLRSPLVYTLSLSVYCTAWTFYGAVGFAVRSGLEYLTIYIGPTLVVIGYWWILRRMVRVARAQKITSIADLISSRFGKSNTLAVMITLMAVAGTTPYIALQLQSVTLSFEAFSSAGVVDGPNDPGHSNATAFWVAMALALFTVLFGTRNLDVNERHHGVVMAIAFEAVVKLLALLAIGIFVVWGLAGGVPEVLARIETSEINSWEVIPSRWAGLIFLSAAAFLTLPRMFQVLIVEIDDERHLRFASWAFPLYVMLISLFVVPIAVVGLESLPAGTNPDLYVLSLPLAHGQTSLATLSFLGGFSSATSMVIVASIALSTMVSNHIVMPIWLRFTGGGATVSGDVRHVVLLSRRLSILGVVLLGYAYYRISGGGAALAAIGLVSFAGVSQFLPPLLGGLFWRGATRSGAISGLTVGFAIWLWCMFLPSFGPDAVIPAEVFVHGPWGIGFLRPQAMFGFTGLDPLVHAVFWSVGLNTLVFTLVSLLSFPSPLERLQGAQFVNVFEHSSRGQRWQGSAAQSEDLMVMAQRILGPSEAQALFLRAAQGQGIEGYLPEPTPDFLNHLERELSGSVGAATAHAMVGQIVGGAAVSVDDLIAVADEAAQIMEYSNQLEAKSEELARTARALGEANEKLTQLSVQKDTFLSQISHELRTPMTSIRAFAEILRDETDVSGEEQSKMSAIIHSESLRLTRLLDDLLDLSVFENGQVNLNVQRGLLADVLDQAVTASGSGGKLAILRKPEREQVMLTTDLDRLAQVFINLISNAQKYCDAARPVLRIEVRHVAGKVQIDFVDNGSGIALASQGLVFEKFVRLDGQSESGAGLGLAICREVVTRLGGAISYLPGQGGAAFRVSLPEADKSI